MRKVKYVPNVLCYPNLTFNKVYDIIEYIPMKGIDTEVNADMAVLIDDRGLKSLYYFLTIKGGTILQDATAEYRDSVIDNILN